MKSIDKEVMPKYTIYDKRPTIGTREVRGESWDMFIVRKMREERLYNEARKDLGNY